MSRLAAVALAALVLSCSTPAPRPRPAAAEPSPAVVERAVTEPVQQPRPEVLLARARALRAEGDLDGARARLEAAIPLGAVSDEVRIELADLLLVDAIDLDRVAALLDGVHEQEANASFQRLAARLAEARGDDAGAAAAYGRALSLGDDLDARLRRGIALERLGRHDEAIVDLERVRVERPDDPVVCSRLADVYEASGKRDAAEAELRRLAEQHPDRAAGWERLARFYERGGRITSAREAIARARAAAARPSRALRPLLPSKH